MIVIGLAVIASLFSCEAKNSLQVGSVGELQSRKSYAAIQFMDVSEDSITAYIKREQKSEPWLYSSADSTLEKLFQQAGLVVNKRFLLSKFNSDTAKETIFIAANTQKYPLTFYTDSTTGTTHFKIKDGTKNIDINTEANDMQQLDYAFIDLIPGGNKELVFLDDYYIMNGDNYHFKVYEIINK